jgi:hypothetical protein
LCFLGGALDQVEVAGGELGAMDDLVDQQPDALVGEVLPAGDEVAQAVQDVQQA